MTSPSCLGACTKEIITKNDLDRFTDRIENILTNQKGRKFFKQFLNENDFENELKCLELYELCNHLLINDKPSSSSQTQSLKSKSIAASSKNMIEREQINELRSRKNQSDSMFLDNYDNPEKIRQTYLKIIELAEDIDEFDVDYLNNIYSMLEDKNVMNTKIDKTALNEIMKHICDLLKGVYENCFVKDTIKKLKK